jgi:hypothetical protein
LDWLSATEKKQVANSIESINTFIATILSQPAEIADEVAASS